jgi:hypothetical protein
MVAATKSPSLVAVPVPLQAVVGVICDALADLEPADQGRALDASRVTLGISTAPDPVSDDARIVLLAEFCQSLRPDQVRRLMEILDMTQKLLLMEFMRTVNSTGG